MGNKLKKVIKNKWVKVKGLYQTARGTMFPIALDCIITNDEAGKTLSIGTEDCMYTIAFEQIEKYLN